MSFFDVRASKWAQNDPQAPKQLQILKAQVMSFPMIYIMSIYEKVDFLMYELQNGFRTALKPFNPPPPGGGGGGGGGGGDGGGGGRVFSA